MMTVRKLAATAMGVMLAAGSAAWAADKAPARKRERIPAAQQETLPGPASPYQSIIEKRLGTIVMVKYVLKLKAEGKSQELETEAPGVMVREDGLVLCSNTPFGGFLRTLRVKAGAVSAEPTDLKVLVGPREKEYKAKLLAKDTDLDLVWIRIENPEKAKFKALDFTTGVKAVLGDRMVAVRRMGKYFDRTPMVAEGRVCAAPEKPRKLLVANGGVEDCVSSPVFTPKGDVIGFVVLQVPDVEEDEAARSLTARQDTMSGKVLPADVVAKATVRALEAAATQPAESPSTTQPAQ
jgi:hypothetical protein